MLIVTGHMTVPPADLPGFVEEAGRLASVARQRDGNLSYDIAVLDAAAGRLLVAERWRDKAALAAHLRANESVAFVSRWQGRMLGDVRQYDAENGSPIAAT
ncbi:antibiotic biosynthesis monooxygenase [Sphingomonas yunnanensis]|uniref:putative quinol monooxygenase n=1 Tax=Sphingomonas yunnanensis TaxID=310400 RepID=UPI001CA7987E|nr:antibiotic biosynthesis monooxygenase family protein [Sphingomonas yunnanensis]MBY9063372.1 antibiotic biosynthesis monooxygenase [Sphingomonas yunnanensis]